MPEDNRFPESLRLAVRPPRWLPGVLFLSHAGGALLISATALPAGVQALLIGLAGLHGWLLLRRHVWQSDPSQPREVVLNSRGEWLLTDGRGRTWPAKLLADALIHPDLVALRFRTAAGVRRVLLSTEGNNAAVLRRLRVRLRQPQ